MTSQMIQYTEHVQRRQLRLEGEPRVYLVWIRDDLYKCGSTIYLPVRSIALARQYPGAKLIHAIRTNDELRLERHFDFRWRRHLFKGREVFRLPPEEVAYFRSCSAVTYPPPRPGEKAKCLVCRGHGTAGCDCRYCGYADMYASLNW